MVDIKDPITIQRKLYNNEDITQLIVSNSYYYISLSNSSIIINKTTKQENEEILRKLDKTLDSNYKKYQLAPLSQQALINEYNLIRSLQQEKLIRYSIANENMLLINSSIIPVQSKFNKFNKFYNCQDLQFKFIIYCYKENYESLLNHVERKFSQFNDFINKFNKNGSITDYLSQSSLSDDDDDDDEEDEDEDFEDEKGRRNEDTNLDEIINDDLNYDLKLQLINEEIISYWNCSFLTLLVYFKLNNFEKLVTEFFKLIELKPINNIDPISVFKKNFETNGVITRDEFYIIITLSILIVKPIRDLTSIISNELFIRFLEDYKDESLLQIFKLVINCHFQNFNNLLDQLMQICKFQTRKNNLKISVILRQKQYLLILSSISQIPLSSFSSLLGIKEDIIEFEVLKLIEYLGLRILYNNNIFQINQKSKDLEISRNIQDLNDLFETIEKDSNNIKQFNEIYG